MGKIKVLLADGSPLFREGLQYIFQHEKDIECIGIAEDGIEVVRLAKELRPDVVIFDVNLPEPDDNKAVIQIKSALPATRVLLLTYCHEPHCIEPSITSKVDGYILKNTSRIQFMNAIRMVYAGEGVFNLKIFEEMMGILTRVDKSKISRRKKSV